MTIRRAACLTLALSAAVGFGCTSGSTTMDQRSEVLWDQTPSMATLENRWDDNTNMFMYTCNTNLHMAVSDLNRALLIDRPSRLTFIERVR